MNGMANLLSGPLVQAIGWALLHAMWQGVLVAAILAAALALLQRQSANARYLASCGALVIIVGLSLVTAIRAYAPLRTAPPRVVAASLLLNDDTAPATISPIIAPSSPDALAVVSAYASSHLPYIVLTWLLGVTLLSTRLIAGWAGAQRLAAGASPAEERWERAMARIAEALHLRATVTLLESTSVDVPTVVGWLRPVVLLPVASLSGLSPEQIEMILAHELAHIRRHDFIVNLLQSTVETLFFYQPAVWWISRRIRVEREHCCDDMAVAVSGDPIRYARALTRFEELRIDAAQTILAASGGSLLSRIRRLVIAHGESVSWSSRWAAGAGLLTVIAALLIAPGLPLFAERETPKQPAEKKVAPAQQTSKTEIVVDASSDDADDIDDEDNATDDNDEGTEAEDHTEAIAEGVAEAVAAAAPSVRVAPIIAGANRAAARAMAEAAREISRGDRKIGEDGKLTVDDLIALRTSGVTPKYIEDMRASGLGNLSLNEILEMRVQGVTPEYIRGLRDAGVQFTSAQTLIELRTQGVNGDYIKGMRAAGYGSANARELIEMRIQGVTPKYVQQMADAGYKNLSAHDLVELRIQGVTSEFVKSLGDAGYANLSVRDLVRLAVSGVNADFIRDLAKYRSKQ